MVLLTAADIKTILDAIVFTNSVKAINAFVVQNNSRRKYTSIDIQNITGQEEIEDIQLTTTTQTFLIHLYYRNRGSGADQEGKIKTTEDQIYNALDAAQTTSTKITILQSWERKSRAFPIQSVVSTLRVTADEISSTSGSGVPGDQITITLPVLGVKTVLNLITDETNIVKSLDRTDSTQVFTKIKEEGLFNCEIEISTTEETQLRTLFTPGDDFALTITKNAVDRVVTANPINFINSTPRGAVQTTFVSMNIKL